MQLAHLESRVSGTLTQIHPSYNCSGGALALSQRIGHRTCYDRRFVESNVGWRHDHKTKGARNSHYGRRCLLPFSLDRRDVLLAERLHLGPAPGIASRTQQHGTAAVSKALPVLPKTMRRLKRCFHKLGVLPVGVLIIRARLFAVVFKAPDFSKLPFEPGAQFSRQERWKKCTQRGWETWLC